MQFQAAVPTPPSEPTRSTAAARAACRSKPGVTAIGSVDVVVRRGMRLLVGHLCFKGEAKPLQGTLLGAVLSRATCPATTCAGLRTVLAARHDVSACAAS